MPSNPIYRLFELIDEYYRRYVALIYRALIICLLIAVHIWLIFAIIYRFESAIALLSIVALCWFSFILYRLIDSIQQSTIANLIAHQLQTTLANRQYVQNIGYSCIAIAFIAFILVDTWNNRVQLISVGGLAVNILLAILCSNNPARIKWRPVIWGIALQFIAGLIVLRWPAGNSAFQWSSAQVVRFLDYTANGTTFVFGFIADPPPICGMDAPFSFTSLPVIIYFGSLTSLLYHYGIVQWTLLRIARAMQYTMGTTAAETLNCVACVFIGPTEASVLMRTSLASMTDSEIMTAFTAGFSSISGSLFAAYIAFGACPVYLLSANVMSAPATLAIAKIIHPETQVSRQKHMDTFAFPPSHESSALESLSNGACTAVWFIFAIIANLVVFLAAISFIDALIGGLGGLVGYPDITFNQLIGYTFFPLAYVMGASDAVDSARHISETLKVAQLIGTKTVLNEFIAYQQMQSMIINNEIGPRAQMIAVYALCGYSNASQIGSQLGIFGSMCPAKKRVYASVAIRSLIAGSIACFMTACVAGILIPGSMSCPPINSADTCVNLTAV